MELTASLTAIHSSRDKNGNVYWAMQFVDHATGMTVMGTISGGESNIYGILRIWDPELNDWDRSIRFATQSLAIRQFEKLTKDWKYAGCTPEELATFIRREQKAMSI